MIKVEHLTKKYGERYAVNDISFEVKKGEIVGFLGPNGAGKSTTMNILTGYLSSTSGRAMIDGLDILEHPMAVKKKIGFLPEMPPLYLEMTVKEYLNFIYDLKKCTLNRKEHIAEICRVVKIEDTMGRMIKNLSKGYPSKSRNRRRHRRQSGGHHLRRADKRTRPEADHRHPESDPRAWARKDNHSQHAYFIRGKGGL